MWEGVADVEQKFQALSQYCFCNNLFPLEAPCQCDQRRWTTACLVKRTNMSLRDIGKRRLGIGVQRFGLDHVRYITWSRHGYGQYM